MKKTGKPFVFPQPTRTFCLKASSWSALAVSMIGLITTPATASATRPLVRTATAIKNLKMTMPVALELAMQKDYDGLKQEDAATRKAALKQANDYIALRKGQWSTAEVNKWFAQCDAQAGKPNENPFCRYEQERVRRRISAGGGTTDRRADRRVLATDIREGRFESVIGKTYLEVVQAVRELENAGHLADTVKTVLDKGDCIASSVPSALGYKLEEQFPQKEIVDSVKSLYRKAASCGSDMPAAQSAFRLGLILIWQDAKDHCSEIPELMSKVEAVPEASQFHARAKFWRYHCAGVMGDEKAKQLAKDNLLKEAPMSFHTLAVAGDDPVVLNQIMGADTPKIAVRSLIRPDMNGLLRGVEALISAGSPHLASEVVDRSVNEIGSLEPEVRLYVATVMNRHGYALPKFKILSSLFQDVPRMASNETMRLYFPLWFYDKVRTTQEKVQAKIDPLLILSLIRQESAFNERAHSSAGAKGLMQVMPATARTIASVRVSRKLFEPDTNINVGSKYLMKRLSQYDGDVELTLAAYNAGFARVDQWRKRYPTDNKMLFLDFIPFRETREYVSSILRNYYWYVRLYSNETNGGVEAAKLNALETKVLAIIKANAGLAATTVEK